MWFVSLLLAMAPEATVLIPTGRFRMGDADMPDAGPVREVSVSAFRIDTTEVSIAAYEAFAAGAGWSDDACWSAEGRAWRAEHPVGAGKTARASGRSADHPVVAVSWYEAEAFCACRGGALPTEAQWERAACGVEPRPAAPAEGSGVRWFEEGKHGWLGEVHTHPVNNDAPKNVFGLSDMVGNVWEWTRDSYRGDGYGRLGNEDPVGTEASLWRSARGGSYMNLPSYAGCSHREPMRPEEPRLTTGFRCVYTP
jgi:formylglycine-generating enzyme required for sulfatase activity